MKFKKTKVILNCLAKDLRNAKEIDAVSHGNALIGLLTYDFASDDEYITTARKWNRALANRISIGLGAGNPLQAAMVQRVASHLNSRHVNQVFTHVGQTVLTCKNRNTIVNALIAPTGEIGKVQIATGPLSSTFKPAVVDARTALAMVKDMGGTSIKFFNMKGLTHFDEAKYLIKLCKEFGFSFEPTGGITVDIAKTIITECVKQELRLVIIHIYSSIIDNKTKRTKINDVKSFWSQIEDINH